MLTVWGRPARTCSASRRDFLRVGALGLGGLTLADVLRLRASAGERPTASPRSVIMVCLAGGPSHIDMYDLKPDAPADVRGDFKPIKTNVPGFDISELFPLQAKIADKLALVRSLEWKEPMQHELQEVYSGFPKASKRPSFGSVVSKFNGSAASTMPAYVSLDEYNAGHAEQENPHYVGSAHRAFLFSGERVRNLGLPPDMTAARVKDRRDLLGSFDSIRRDLDARGEFAGMDAFTARAVDMITSPKARAAFDLSKESEKVRARYGAKDSKFVYGNDPKAYTHHWAAEKFLMARRLVEAGVSVVTLQMGTWDYHGTSSGTGNIFTGLRSQLPLLDRSVSALVGDLHERGLDKEVAVVVWGEFGRTPKVNNVEGRDHWPAAGFAVLAGGGFKTGQVIGSTDSKGAAVKTRPLGPQNVLATIYTTLGIDPAQSLPDFTGRPTPLLDDPRPIDELL